MRMMSLGEFGLGLNDVIVAPISRSAGSKSSGRSALHL